MAVKDIIVRPIEDDDYLEIGEWMKARKWPMPPSKGALPPTGYIAEENGEKLATAFLYVTNSSVAILDWITTNPKSGFRGIVGVKKINDHVKKITEPRVQAILHFCGNDKLATYMVKKLGYKKTDKVQTLAWVR